MNLFTNIYDTGSGTLSDSAEQFAQGQSYATSLADVKDDVYHWLRFGLGRYVATLSNSAADHTAEIKHFADDMTDTIQSARNMGLDLPDDWRDLQRNVAAAASQVRTFSNHFGSATI